MKPRYWITIVAASVCCGSAGVWANGVQGEPPLPTLRAPPIPATRLDGAESFPPNADHALPNRRVPSLAPPQPGDTHPVTPDKAWGKAQPSVKPAPLSGNLGAGSIGNGEAHSGKAKTDTNAPLLGPTQPLNDTGVGDTQPLLRTGK